MEWLGIGVAILIAVVGWIIERSQRTKADSKESGYRKRAFEDMEKTLSKHDKYHGEHYATTRLLQNSEAALGQQVADHAEHDDERFGRIESMLTEMRGDIKDMLVRLGGGRK